MTEKSRCFAGFLIVILSSLLLLGCGRSGTASIDDDKAVFTLRGAVTPANQSDYDSDTELRYDQGLELNNNDYSDAQTVDNPVTLGGYVSGTEGNYSTKGSYVEDAVDIFRASLITNQQIRLTTFLADIEHSRSGGTLALTLSLRAVSDPDAVLQSLSFDKAETRVLNVQQSGDTFIRIDSQVGVCDPLLYTLTISELLSATNTGGRTPDMSAHFVPGEVIVKLKPTANAVATSSTDSDLSDKKSPLARPSVTASRAFHALAQRHGMQSKREVASSLRLLKLDVQASVASALSGTEDWTDEHRLKWQTLQAIDRLKKDPDVLYAEPNYIRRATAVPNDTEFNRQWNLSIIDLPAAWDITHGEGVSIAVIDTGVDAAHLDLMANINTEEDYDFVSDIDSAGDGDGRDADPDDRDKSRHGTHVAGIVAAVGNNGQGVAGVAYGATLLPLRVLGANGEGNDADVADAIYYAAGLPVSGMTPLAMPVDIINLSLGSAEVSNTLTDAVNAAIDAGVIVVAAAGNNGADELFYPAAVERAIAVSSVTDHKTLSGFSNYGDFIDVAAPGGTGYNDYAYDGFQDGILSTVYASEYSELSGTSMAAPHVSGVIALMIASERSEGRTLSLASIQAGLDGGFLTESLENPQKFGAGLINAAKALTWLGQPIPDQLNLFPTQLGFVGAADSAELSLNNPGTGSVIIDALFPSENWLELVPIPGKVFASGLGRYEVNINRAALPLSGSISAYITVHWQLNGVTQASRKLDVFVSNTPNTSDQVGLLYIYLLRRQDSEDSESGDSVEVYASVNGAYRNGQYSFSLFNVEPGEYFLKASTDNDGDFSVFDDGEAKGVYPLRSSPSIIKVSNADINNLDFEVAYESFGESSSTSSPRLYGSVPEDAANGKHNVEPTTFRRRLAF